VYPCYSQLPIPAFESSNARQFPYLAQPWSAEASSQLPLLQFPSTQSPPSQSHIMPHDSESPKPTNGDGQPPASPGRRPSISLQAAATLNAGLQRESPSRGMDPPQIPQCSGCLLIP